MVWPAAQFLKRIPLGVAAGAVLLLYVLSASAANAPPPQDIPEREQAQARPTAPAQKPAQPDQARPEPVSILLLARPGLTDPNFARTVVLVTRTPGHDTIGVILNRRLGAGALTLPDELIGRDVYFGGPLAPRGLLGIGPRPATAGDERAEGDSEIAASGVVAVLPGLHLVVGSRRVRALAAAQTPERVKLFSGYAGWAPQQLESEIVHGGWLVQAATEAIVFDADPDTLWERLIARARAVRAPVPPAGCAAGYNACLVRMYSLRSIERTSISRTSLP